LRKADVSDVCVFFNPIRWHRSTSAVVLDD